MDDDLLGRIDDVFVGHEGQNVYDWSGLQDLRIIGTPHVEYRCECSREFATPRGLTTHRRYCWVNERLNACPICRGGSGRACDSHFA